MISLGYPYGMDDESVEMTTDKPTKRISIRLDRYGVAHFTAWFAHRDSWFLQTFCEWQQPIAANDASLAPFVTCLACLLERKKWEGIE